jgi:hypothetical protein
MVEYELDSSCISRILCFTFVKMVMNYSLHEGQEMT